MNSEDEGEYIPMNPPENNCITTIKSFFSSIWSCIKNIFKMNEEPEIEGQEEDKQAINLLSLEEKEKRKDKLEEIFKRQKESRNISNNKALTKEEEKEKINQTLEDMSTMGTIIKEQIIEEKKTHPEKFVSIQDAVTKKNKDNDNPLFIMGLLAQNLENQGVTTAIEKESSNDNNNEASSTALQFMINGMGMQKKYKFHFDFGEERNEQLLNDEQEQKIFNDKLKRKLSKEFNIDEDEIIISFPQKGSYLITAIIKQKEFFELDKKQLIEKFKNEPELGKLKDLHTDLILSGCKLTPDMFDSRGNNKDGGWGINETRGGEPYIPPEGWIRYGLNVSGKYDNGNDDWLAYDNRKREWCVAYHGVGQGQSSDKVKNIVNLIANSNLKPGSGQAYEYDEDCRHKPNKVGRGVYCTPNPKVIIDDDYAGKVDVNGEQYYMAFMLRVNPDKIRCSESKKDYWVLNGDDSEIRPYGILIKKV